MFPMGAWWQQQATRPNPPDLSAGLKGFAPMKFPDVTGKGAPDDLLGGIDVMIGITKSAKDFDAACTVLMDWIGGAGAQTLINTFNDLPAYKGMAPQNYSSDNQKKVWALFTEDWLPKVKYARQFKQPAVKQAFEDATAAVAAGDETPEAAMAAVQKALGRPPEKVIGSAAAHAGSRPSPSRLQPRGNGSSWTNHDRAGVIGGGEGLLFVSPALILFLVFVLYPTFYIVYASLFRWDGLNPGIYCAAAELCEDAYRRPGVLAGRAQCGLLGAADDPAADAPGFPDRLRADLGRAGPDGAARDLLHAGHHLAGGDRHRLAAHLQPVRRAALGRGLRHRRQWLTVPFLSDTNIAIFAVIAVNVWQWTGFSMLLYIAGLQGVPEELIDAAKIAGANTRQTVRHVIWPMLRHVHLTLILLGVIGTLQTFPLIYMMTSGGPNHATETLPNYIFLQAFKLQSMGYASALSVVLLLLALGLSLFQVRVLGARFSLAQ